MFQIKSGSDKMDACVAASQGEDDSHCEAVNSLLISSLQDILDARANRTSKGCLVAYRPNLQMELVLLANRGLLATSTSDISLARGTSK